MKPIAIITFHSSHNSGSMLQAYALQNKLKELGYENDIIDFSNDGQRKLYSVMPSVVWHGFVRKTLILRWLKTLPYYFILENQKKFYLDFKSSYLDMTFKEYRNNKELCSENFEYSYYNFYLIFY